ncbi:MAG: hypothetical protein WC364_08860 [Eubacteriales bacterium]
MIKLQNCIEVERICKRVSFAVWLQDDYTAQAKPAGQVTVIHAGAVGKATYSPGGYYVFTDLTADDVTIAVEAEHYLRAEALLKISSLDQALPVRNITLIPDSSYPSPAGATLLRGTVSDSNGKALPEAEVAAVFMLPESSAKARIGNGGCAAGDLSINLANLSGLLTAGDTLLIQDPITAYAEICRIADPLPADLSDPYNIAGLLKHSHSSGTPLYLMKADINLNTRTAESGEFVVYLKQPVKKRELLVSLEISCPGFQINRREVQIFEGSSTSLGVISLNPVS